MLRLRLLFVVLFALAWAGQIEAAGIYYGAAYSSTMSGHTQLVTVDPNTGQVTRIGEPMSDPNRLHGLVRANDGQLYGINGSDDSLYAVDPVTGQPTLIGPTGYSLVWGLAYDPASDTIYGLGRLNGDDTPRRLIVFDRSTAAVTPVGPGTTALTNTSGLAWDTSHNRLIAFDNLDDKFYAFDTYGNATLLSVASPRLSTWGIAHDGQHVVMQLQGYEDNRKMAFYDPDTGLRVGDLLTLSEPAPMEALHFVPEPSTLVLLSMAAVGLLVYALRMARRKRI